jgi:hypothetical protein
VQVVQEGVACDQMLFISEVGGSAHHVQGSHGENSSSVAESIGAASRDASLTKA